MIRSHHGGMTRYFETRMLRVPDEKSRHQSAAMLDMDRTRCTESSYL